MINTNPELGCHKGNLSYTMNICELYKTSIKCPSRWNYYDGNSIETYDELFPQNQCFRFIYRYLGKGEKSEVEVLNMMKNLSSDRLLHIISTFFFGIEIFNRCKKIQDNIVRHIPIIDSSSMFGESPTYRFHYIWMLICLFHDCGYAIEERRTLIENAKMKKALSSLLKESKPKVFPYSSRIIRQYEKYREIEMGVRDHGIIGGALLYKDLCDLRKKRVESRSNRLWPEILENDFLLAAWAIACHNIFKTNEGSVDSYKYKFYKLEKLISSDKIIKFDKHPILFLLCLVDSIDPLKQVEDISQLNDLDVEFSDNRITLEMAKLPDPVRLKYLKKIKDLDSWLTKTTTHDNQTRITIEI